MELEGRRVRLELGSPKIPAKLRVEMGLMPLAQKSNTRKQTYESWMKRLKDNFAPNIWPTICVYVTTIYRANKLTYQSIVIVSTAKNLKWKCIVVRSITISRFIAHISFIVFNFSEFIAHVNALWIQTMTWSSYLLLSAAALLSIEINRILMVFGIGNYWCGRY